MEKIEKMLEGFPNVTVLEKISNGNGRYINNLANLMNISNGDDINYVLSILFSKFGFTEKDSIVIDDILKNAWDMVELQFKINGEKTWCAKFHNRFGTRLLGMAVTDEQKDYYSYVCKVDERKNSSEPDEEKCTSEIDVYMVEKGYDAGKGKKQIICERSVYGVKYTFCSPVSKNGKEAQIISLKIDCPLEVQEQLKRDWEFYIPKNERALIAYLSNCTYPVNIDKIYQDIVSLSFDGDITDYPLFDLHTLMTRQFKGENERIITDSIKLKNGKLESFGMMHKGSSSGCSIKNHGAAVEFIGNGWMNYHVLTPKNGYVRFGTQGVEEEDSLIDPEVVSEVAVKMIELFPEQAERMLGRDYFSKCQKSHESDQIDMFSMMDSPKQLSKSDDKK